MTKLELQVIILLLSMIAGFLAVPFTQWLCDLDANFFNHTPATQILERTRIARAVMDADLAAVRSCDAIYLLRGWQNSRGAKKELAEAIKYGLKVMLEGAEDKL